MLQNGPAPLGPARTPVIPEAALVGGLVHIRTSLRCRLLADFVAKVENRTTPKISRKVIFRELYVAKRHDALRRFVVGFPRNDVVPHVATRNTRQRP